MTNTEFSELFKKSGLGKKEIASLLGVGRGTIYNYLGNGLIPDTKADFIRDILSRDKEVLKKMIKEKGFLDPKAVVRFSVENWDMLMQHKDFRNKVSVEAYQLANDILKEKLS